MAVKINKAGRKHYLNEDKESLVIASAEIKASNGLPLDYLGVAQQLKNLVTVVKYRCSDYNTQEKSSLRY